MRRALIGDIRFDGAIVRCGGGILRGGDPVYGGGGILRGGGPIYGGACLLRGGDPICGGDHVYGGAGLFRVGVIVRDRGGPVCGGGATALRLFRNVVRATFFENKTDSRLRSGDQDFAGCGKRNKDRNKKRHDKPH